MEDGLVHELVMPLRQFMHVLILVVMEDGLVPTVKDWMEGVANVLILVVMEDGLVRRQQLLQRMLFASLNPCCNGRWSRTPDSEKLVKFLIRVLILVVMEDGLVHWMQGIAKNFNNVS